MQASHSDFEPTNCALMFYLPIFDPAGDRTQDVTHYPPRPNETIPHDITAMVYTNKATVMTYV